MFFIIMLILQIFLYFLALKRKENVIWKELFFVEIISIISVLIYIKIYSLLDISDSWNVFGVLILGFFVIAIYVFSLIISIITRIIIKKKILTNQKKSKIVILMFIITFLFIIVTAIETKPLIDERIRRKEFSIYLLTYLNNRYGNGNYKIQNIYNWNDCGIGCINNGHPNAYEFTIQSDYLNDKFIVQMNIETKQVEKDNFIEIYAKENNWCEGNYLNNCLEDLILSQENSYISNVNDYEVNLSVSFDFTYGKTDYGRAPTLEELMKEATITFDDFTIYKEFDNKNEDEFKYFMIELYKNYAKYYKQYNSTNIIDFKFVNGNPFFEDTLYGYHKNEGYIKEDDNNIYIYINASPIIVSRKEIDEN